MTRSKHNNHHKKNQCWRRSLKDILQSFYSRLFDNLDEDGYYCDNYDDQENNSIEEYSDETVNDYPRPIARRRVSALDRLISAKKTNEDEYSGIIGRRELKDIERYIRNGSETFQQRLFRMIDERGMSDVEVYTRAGISRQLFSKIRSNRYYVPAKRTALALCFSLRLTLEEVLELLMSSGMTLSSASKEDLVVRYCLTHNILDIDLVNDILYEFNLPLL